MSEAQELAFQEAFQEHLDVLQPELVQRIREILRCSLPGNADALLFLYAQNSFDTTAFPVTSNALESIEPDWEYWPDTEGHLLIEDPIPNLPDWGNSGTYDVLFVVLRRSAETFYRAWQEAGGSEYPTPAYFAGDDENDRLNLKTGEWEPW